MYPSYRSQFQIDYQFTKDSRRCSGAVGAGCDPGVGASCYSGAGRIRILLSLPRRLEWRRTHASGEVGLRAACSHAGLRGKGEWHRLCADAASSGLRAGMAGALKVAPGKVTT